VEDPPSLNEWDEIEFTEVELREPFTLM